MPSTRSALHSTAQAEMGNALPCTMRSPLREPMKVAPSRASHQCLMHKGATAEMTTVHATIKTRAVKGAAGSRITVIMYRDKSGSREDEVKRRECAAEKACTGTCIVDTMIWRIATTCGIKSRRVELPVITRSLFK